MSDDTQPETLLTATEIATRAERRVRHPLNPNSDVYLKQLVHDYFGA